jgi:UDP-N-acetylglucosamine--N-acetylmuramyl-(pentapeptide) pyrophosphoryl-undecaprenol N-acetylglucosamine transferase
MKLLISAGGTGGHIFPGIAVGEALMARGSDHAVIFLGTTEGLEGMIIPRYGFRLLFIEARQFLGRSPYYKAKTLLHVLKGIGMAARIIGKEKPDAVLGMGGFTSVPVVLAAVMKGIPAFIHEQNLEPGLANKLLSGFAKETFTSFERSADYLKGKRVVHSGNPLRKTLGAPKKKTGQETFTVFVFGGSRGARSINRSVVAMLPRLESYPNVTICHQTGNDDFPLVREAYSRTSVTHEVFPFAEDMGSYYNRADVIICRAGATTIFELAYYRKAAILIPYPYAAGNHQWKNASEIEKLGGAYVINDSEATGERLEEILRHLMKEPALVDRMGENIGRIYVEDAAERILDHIEKRVRKDGNR